ncbi:zinc resistance protein [Salidesulfovibrio onnuriiensis]|uniref:zinc resistance protein n=1 Tax=Salidesulfovibrio onnuriiensis TaxID=2583823 RepID=UPI0011CA0A66|nr:zinc resistance protein [Salidesulfovibrio onnuriiensis]
MKKSIIALALIVAAGIAFVTTDAMAWGNGNCGNWGGNAYNAQTIDTKAYQDFMSSTQKLRADIAADRAERAAIMAGTNPDAKRVRALTEQISEKIATLNEKATALNLPPYGMGRGMGAGMGPGMGHGRGHGRGMQGANGYNNNCPWW